LPFFNERKLGLGLAADHRNGLRSGDLRPALRRELALDHRISLRSGERARRSFPFFTEMLPIGSAKGAS
jgi:hypothetical protein